MNLESFEARFSFVFIFFFFLFFFLWLKKNYGSRLQDAIATAIITPFVVCIYFEYITQPTHGKYE